jgi:D-aminopeptidase
MAWRCRLRRARSSYKQGRSPSVDAISAHIDNSPFQLGQYMSTHNHLSVQFEEKQIDSIFAKLDQCHLPGISVGVAVGGKPVYRKSFGLASMNLPTALSPGTRMRVGSISKQFTVLAYLLLCEEGRARIDDPIGKHLPELHPTTHKVTMHQLMSHTSGLRDSNDLVHQFSGIESNSVSAADYLSMYYELDDVNAPPGTTCLYNNGAYVVLSAVIERITRQPLEEALHDYVFGPIGMHDTLLRRWDYTFVPNSADSHLFEADKGWKGMGIFGGRDQSGAAMVVSTIDDMLRWMAHMDAPRVGSAATWEAMKTPPMLLNGTRASYGLGLYSLTYRGAVTLQHGGGLPGVNAVMLKFPAAALDVVAITNRSDINTANLAEKVVDACLPNLDPVVYPAEGQFTTGLFLSPRTSRVLQLYPSQLPYNPKGLMQIAAIDGHPLPFAPDRHGVLRTTSPALVSKIVLTRVGDLENPTSVLFDEFGNPDEFVPVKRVLRQDAEIIVGRYRSDTTGTELTISAAGEGARMSSKGRFGTAVHDLECLTEGIWESTAVEKFSLPMFGMLRFDNDYNVLSFSNYLTRNLRFRRSAP